MTAAAAKPASPAGDLTGRRLGRYEVLCMLASGGMATVYVARAQGVAGFERLVAVKVLHPHLAHDEDFISMFLDEARLAARIRHPNAVGTLDISDTQGDGYFLVMEYVEGDHFGALLRNAAKGRERLPVAVVARIVMDALAGLNAAHRLTDSSGTPLDLVHRDVSPHNILVGNDGVARITDFGVAKAQVRLSSTRDGQFKGKLSYMAPEQAASGQADQRSDLFSMGIVLWEGLTGRRLFRGENNADVLNKILNPQVPPPSTFDASLAPFDAVAAKALARDPGERFQNAEEFLEAVEEAALHIGGVATPRAVAREVKRWLGDKVEHERATIQNATEALGRSELTAGVLPRPMESDSHSQPSMPGGQSLVRSIASEDATVGARPSRMADEEGGSKRTVIIVAAVVALFLVAGVGLAFVFLGGEGTTPEAAAPPAADEPSAAPPADDTTAAAVQPATVEPEDGANGTASDDGAEDANDEGSANAPDDETAHAAHAETTAESPSDPAASRRHAARRAARRARRRAREQDDEARAPTPPARRTEPEDDVLANPYSR